jgi:hypothetical protein
MADEKTSAQPFKGMPHVEIKQADKVAVHVELNDKLSKEIVASQSKGPIQISLETLHLDSLHSQSPGLMRASTGCISNPGGPSC